MEKLGSTNAHGKVPFSTGSDFPSITTQAFTAILPPSSPRYSSTLKNIIHTNHIHCSLSFVWFLFYRNPLERAEDRRENLGVKIARGGSPIFVCLAMSHMRTYRTDGSNWQEERLRVQGGESAKVCGNMSYALPPVVGSFSLLLAQARPLCLSNSIFSSKPLPDEIFLVLCLLQPSTPW